VNITFVTKTVPLLARTDRPAAQIYRDTAAEALSTSPDFDAAIVVVLDEYTRLPDVQDPYLQTKALALMAGVPVQEVKLSTLKRPPQSLQYILQNIAVALYAKMGGTPWTVDHDLTINDEIVIGIGTCELSSRFAERRRYVGITTVFRGDGNYLLSNLSKECDYEDYPQELRASTMAVLSEIKARNGWRSGDSVRIIFHSYKPLRKVEVAEIVANCARIIGAEQNVQFAFLTVSHDHPFLALELAQRGIPVPRSNMRKGEYAPERGTIVRIGRYTQLLCTNGPRLVKREEAPLPTPLLVHLHPESTFRDLTYLTKQVLKFTSLSWRSVLPARKPVTIYYSELIARLLARLRAVKDWSPAMLNVKLRASKWFL
jgi:argonaute-like protein implicated in RNA metabolism and viral defense